MMVGRTRSASTRPPTSGAERGRPKKLRNIARPSRPKIIEGTAARLLMLTSMIWVEPVLGGELLEIDGRRNADRQAQDERHEQREGGADERTPDAGELRFARIARGEETPGEMLLDQALVAQLSRYTTSWSSMRRFGFGHGEADDVPGAGVDADQALRGACSGSATIAPASIAANPEARRHWPGRCRRPDRPALPAR